MGLFGTNEMTGIDVGAGSIKVVRIKPGKRPRLSAAGMIEFPPDAAGVSAGAGLHSLLSEKKIGRQNVITHMPGKDLTIRSLALPKIPLAELREAVRWEAKRHISYPIDTALVEYLISGEKREGAVDKYDILMVAAEVSRIREHLALFEEARIKVAAVDANALALRNVLRIREKKAMTDTLVVDIGAGKTEINIFKEGALRFSRCLETGGSDMTRAVADHLGIGFPDAETLKRSVDVLASTDQDKTLAVLISRLDALLMEIRRSVEYYKTAFRERSVERAIVTGGATQMKGLPEYFSQSLGLPVELLDPFGHLACSDALREEFGPVAPRFSAAVGLALRQG